jgi:hypothetical protein
VGQNLYIAGNTGAPKANWTAAIGEFFLSNTVARARQYSCPCQTKTRLLLKEKMGCYPPALFCGLFKISKLVFCNYL